MVCSKFVLVNNIENIKALHYWLMGPIRSSMAYCGKRLCDLHTCEKVMEFFSIQIVYFFSVYSSFHTRHPWGGQYQLCQFLLDFDDWLHLSDILKRTSRSKPDVAFVWHVQCTWMTSRYGENDHYYYHYRKTVVTPSQFIGDLLETTGSKYNWIYPLENVSRRNQSNNHNRI